jgi:hypothetical protein
LGGGIGGFLGHAVAGLGVVDRALDGSLSFHAPSPTAPGRRQISARRDTEGGSPGRRGRP